MERTLNKNIIFIFIIATMAGSFLNFEAYEASELEQTEESRMLYIGLTDDLKEVPYEGEASPDALIAALAEETGWNLTLAQPVTENTEENSITVSFAEDSTIYTTPPEQQKEAYQVFDAEDLIYTVLNSTAETLLENLAYDQVYFSSPDGGNLDFGNGGCSFYLSAHYPWNEEGVWTANEPLPEDSVGWVYFWPSNESLAGATNLSLLFKREGVEPGNGKITVYQEDGTVFFQCDVSDEERVGVENYTSSEVDDVNWKSATLIVIYLDQPLEAEKNYTVQVDAGAFTAGELKTKALGSEGTWAISCTDYGMGKDSAAGKDAVKLGESVTQEFIFGDSVERITAKTAEGSMGTVTPGELTEDGIVTIQPESTGVFHVAYQFILKDGSVIDYGTIYDVEE